MAQLPGTWCDVERPILNTPTRDPKRCVCGRRLILSTIFDEQGSLIGHRFPPHKTPPRIHRRPHRRDRGARVTHMPRR